MVYTEAFPFPFYQTAAQKRTKEMNIKKTEICNRFLESNPDLTDEQQLRVFRERFRAATPESFSKALESMLKQD